MCVVFNTRVLIVHQNFPFLKLLKTKSELEVKKQYVAIIKKVQNYISSVPQRIRSHGDLRGLNHLYDVGGEKGLN